LIGRALCQQLAAAGHQVWKLTRQRTLADSDQGVFFDALTGDLDAAKLEGLDAVIHLAGESIAQGRWTAARKQRIRDSRVNGTAALARAIAAAPRKPPVFISASAVGIYGQRGSAVLTEQSEPGAGFLADVGRAWEQAADPARQAGVRVVHPRLGVVLSPAGGALAKMLTPFKLGLGGPLGSGDQYLSWISRADVVGALLHALRSPAVQGPVNVASPTPLTNREFVKTLGRVLRRPTVLPAPGWALRLALGAFADEALLASQRVMPMVLQSTGYVFHDPHLEEALREMLNGSGRSTEGDIP
jgi:uncharacterized protein (TIGR01777 family)